MFDLSQYLGMPPDASAHGHEIDFMMGLVHWLMLALFLFWAPFFLYTLYRFRASKQPKAIYSGVKSKFSTYLEGGVVLAEAILLVGFAFPIWGELKHDFPAEETATVAHVVAEQFAWNVHYPGPDGVFGERRTELVDVALNPLGLDRDDPNAADDITTVNELFLPVNKPVILQISSKDVIHSFALPHFRVKQDAIPGLVIPVHFMPVQTGEYEISCAQLCGLSHYRMKGYVTIQTQEAFDAWIAEQSPAPAEPAPPPDSTAAEAL